MGTHDHPIDDDSEFEAEARLNDNDVESDDESLLEADSPADGYFEQREHPQDTFAERSGAAQVKAEEAAREDVDSRSSPAMVRPSQSNAPQPISSPAWTAEDPTPVLDAGPAPPDYAAATAHRRTEFGSDHPLVRNGLFGNQGTLTPGEQPQPQSMTDLSCAPPNRTIGLRGGDAYDPERHDELQTDEGTGLLSGRRRGGYDGRKTKSRRLKKSSLFKCVLVFFSVLALLALVSTLIGTSKSIGRTPDDGRHQPQLPITQPPNASFPPTPGCSQNNWAYSMAYDFDVKTEFRFKEQIQSWAYIDQVPAGIAISGKISIGGPYSRQDSDVTVGVNIITTPGLNITNYNYFKDEHGIEFKFPTIEWYGAAGEKPCMQFWVHIAVNTDVEIPNLSVFTRNLAVIGQEPWKGEKGIKVLNETSIWAMNGHVNLVDWDSRTTVIETNSGHIGGTYGLRDLLRVKSQSGSIDIGVDPKEVDKKRPKPAEFIAQSNSGSVRATFPADELGYDIPERDYITRVETQSSSIAGTYIHGISSSFKCNSCGMDLELLPYDSGKKKAKSTLRTENHSGHTTLELLSPYIADDDAYSSSNRSDAYSPKHKSGKIDLMSSRHTSVSGSVEVKYPQEWEGEARLESTSGSVELKGKDIELFSGEIPSLIKQIVGWKGDGDSKLTAKTSSGSLKVIVGDM